jgi:hypothetical protein
VGDIHSYGSMSETSHRDMNETIMFCVRCTGVCLQYIQFDSLGADINVLQNAFLMWAMTSSMSMSHRTYQQERCLQPKYPRIKRVLMLSRTRREKEERVQADGGGKGAWHAPGPGPRARWRLSS